jgi:hypothetical protein
MVGVSAVRVAKTKQNKINFYSLLYYVMESFQT